MVRQAVIWRLVSVFGGRTTDFSDRVGSISEDGRVDALRVIDGAGGRAPVECACAHV